MNLLRERLFEHLFHDTEIVIYGTGNETCVCLECNDCGCVILDSDIYDLKGIDEDE